MLLFKNWALRAKNIVSKIAELSEKIRSPNIRLAILALTTGLALTLILENFQLSLLEAYLYDFRVRSKTKQTRTADSSHIVLVTIDDRSVEQLNDFPPLSLKHHIDLLNVLGQGSPKAIAYFLNFNDALTGSEIIADQFVRTADNLFSAGTPVIIGTEVDDTGEIMPPFPLSKLPHRIATIHKDGATFSEDKVTRRALFSVYDEPVLHVQLAGTINDRSKSTDYRGIYSMPEIDAQYFYINYIGPTQDGRSVFEEISAIDLIEHRVSPDSLRGKIVLVGTKTREDSNDYIYTPYSREIFTNSKLVVHANIIETLIHDNAIIRANRTVDYFITLILTSFIIFLVFKTTPIAGVFITIACASVLILVSMIIFRMFGVWIGLAHPLLGTFFAYYVFVPYRLIMEYKTRWQLQRRNEILLQVEELKSNFMSLITHDLKTPVARIQGLAELLKRNGSDSAIVTDILKSTDELNRFITSILELAKIESNHVILNKTSRDVNRIIEECVRSFQFQAKQKNISIESDLEPLFPVRIDASLITKVIANLIDNAIKYSPSGARVTVESRESTEKPGFIEINVIDTGYGIAAKDVDNLFTKFYRPKNDFTMVTKGTGLGLYLSRYFVELHNGQLNAESVEGKGSIFTILLPLDEEQTVASSDQPLNDRERRGESHYV